MRLDQFVSEKIWLSRNRAQFLISSWLVKVNWILEKKNWLQISDSDLVEIAEDRRKDYVSRSAVKLFDFLSTSDLHVFVNWKKCLDVGASTWWFTQVLLDDMAYQVFAIDVGSSQLHEKIKSDSRVISKENTDIRSLDVKDFGSGLDLIVVDVSFISLSKIIDCLISLMSSDSRLIMLFKPQFEVGNSNLNKRTWVPKNQKIITIALNSFKCLCKEKGLEIIKISESSLPGESWNIEYFILASKLWCPDSIN